MKIFSSYDDYGYEDERLYSVLLDEEELALFSEIQKEFARKDYEGLARNQQVNLHARRSDYAKELWEGRKARNASLGEVKDLFNVYDNVSMTDIVEGGGIESTNKVRINRRAGETPAQSAKRALNAQKNQMLKGSKEASDLMRKEVLEGVGPEASKEARAKANKFLNQMDNTKKPKIKTSGVDPLPKPISERLSEAKESGKLEKFRASKKSPVPTNKKGMIRKATEFAKRNKKALGVTAGLTAATTAGAYLYNKNKKKKNQE